MVTACLPHLLRHLRRLNTEQPKLVTSLGRPGRLIGSASRSKCQTIKVGARGGLRSGGILDVKGWCGAGRVSLLVPSLNRSVTSSSSQSRVPLGTPSHFTL